MNTDVLAEKLKQLNPRLFIDLAHRTYATGSELGTSGVYYRGRLTADVDASGAGAAAIKAADELNASPHTMIGWTQHGSCPEGDLFNLDTGRVIALGWRSLIRRILARKLATPKQAQRVFGYTESFYDRLDYNGRLDFHRTEAGWEPK